jgi:hypothetical protein
MVIDLIRSSFLEDTMSQFKAEELITKRGKSYPVVGGRLRIAHEDNETLSISTELIQYDPMVQAVVKAKLTTTKGVFTAFGASSCAKDEKLVDSLLELAETRSIARALRFAGYGVEYTGVEEIGDVRVTASGPNPARIQEIPAMHHPATQMSLQQRKAIESIARLKHWDAVEAARRILSDTNIQSLDNLSNEEATEVIKRFKAKVAS